jgi:hypothetical protein
MTKRGGVMKRMLASVLRAAVALALVSPTLGAGLTAHRDCPSEPVAGRLAFVNAMPDGACEHTGAGPCLTALGCVTPAPALTVAVTGLMVPSGSVALEPRQTPRFADLYSAGPPTPPPNHI